MPGAVPPDVPRRSRQLSGAPAAIRPHRRGNRAFEQLSSSLRRHRLRDRDGPRPQTLYGLADSPVGLAAWMLDHDAAQLRRHLARLRATDSRVGISRRDEVLDNITLYWLTNTGVSSARLYRENKFGFFDVKGVSVPAAVSVFPDELYQAPRSWAEQRVPQPHLLQRGRRGRTLRRLAGAGALRRPRSAPASGRFGR